MFLILGHEFNSLLEYMIKGRIYIPIENIFLTLREKDEAEKNNFKGVYIFLVEYYNRKVEYEFVFEKIEKTENGTFLCLAPILLPDLDIFDYIFPDENKELYGRLSIDYHPFKRSDYITDKYELVDFDRLIEPIYTQDLYITEEGIHYKINETMCLENKEEIKGFYLHLDMLKSLGINLKIMEEDGFLGDYNVVLTFNTGEQIVETYSISNIDNQFIYLKDKIIPNRNRRNIPQFIRFERNNNKIMIVWQESYHEYVPFTNKEN